MSSVNDPARRAPIHFDNLKRIRQPNPCPLGRKVFGIACHQLPAVDACAGPDHGVGQFQAVAAAQVQALDQRGFVKLNAFEVGVNDLARSVFQARRRFDLRFYPGDGADVSLFEVMCATKVRAVL